ncbi:restriction endonuclease subunit S [Streptomyces sp. Je 1-332]|uniref:restriction endonuclease subunit S n=1 Tax=Streptomyces sp. Je 1-332 TaxID=3231270 RepID=UPI003457FAEA
MLTPTKDAVTVVEDAQYETAGLYSYARGLFRRPVIFGSETNYRQYNRLRSGQIVYSKLFGWEGAVASVPEEFDGIHVSHEFPTFEVDDTKLDPRYVRHYVTWPSFHAALSKEASGMGSRRQRVKPERFLSSQIPLPDLLEQRRIADKLDAAMGSISRVVQLKKESDALVRQHADALFGSIAEQRPLSSVLDESNDFVAVSPEKKYRTAGILNRGRGLFHRPVISGNETKYPRYNQLKSQQFVYSKLFGWEGSLAVVSADFNGIHVSHEFPTFDIDEEVADVSYMTHLARWDGLHHRLKDQGSGMGSRRQRVNVSRLLATEVPLPSLPAQRRIAERLTLARGVAEAGARQDADLETLRKGLLDAAFSGRL